MKNKIFNTLSIAFAIAILSFSAINAYANETTVKKGYASVNGQVIAVDLQGHGRTGDVTHRHPQQVHKPVLASVSYNTAGAYQEMWDMIPADLKGQPRSQLAILPGASHMNIMLQTSQLLAMVPAFLDAPFKK